MADAPEPFVLRSSEQAFAQDLRPWVAAGASTPGCRRLEGARVVTLRHAAASQAARDAVERVGLRWPAATGEQHGDSEQESTLVVRCQPEELMLVSLEPAPADALLASLAPGLASDAVALDLSHGMLVLALEGPYLDLWLSRLVDAASIPSRRGSATRARLVDVAVTLLRLEDDQLWLVADRALAPYLADWLAFTHEGAFAKDLA